MSNDLNKIIVVKLGGATLSSHNTAIEDIVELQRRDKSLVLVHGGGKLISEWLAKQGISSTFVQGERVTDQPTLEVVTAVLAGLVNKEIVAAINCLGGQAVGISGVDGALVEGRIEDKGRGYVGTITKVNTASLKALLKSGFIPVVATVGLNSSDRAANTPKTLNFNADFVAGEIAAAIAAEKLVFLTDVEGVNDKVGNLIPLMKLAEAKDLLDSGVASGGMIPKIKACLRALSNTATTCIIDGGKPHTLLKEIEGESGGTVIRA